MRHCLVFLFLLVIGSPLWSQTESSSPFSTSFSYKGDLVNNMKGGISTGTTFAGIATAHFTFNLEKARWWKGGVLQVYLSNTHGGLPSNTLAGAYQSVSNIEAGNRTFFQEFWFEQAYRSLSIKLGIQDLNAEFSGNELGSSFINSSFGIQSTFNDNLPVSIFPVTGFGGVLRWAKGRCHTARVGLFEGNPECLSIYPWVFRIPFMKRLGTLTIVEYSYCSEEKAGVQGCYKVGAYYHNHTANERVSDTGRIGSNSGFYLVANQCLYRFSGSSSFNLFAQLSFSSVRASNNHLYWGVGLNVRCPFNREGDEVGFAVAQARFNEGNSPHETIWEGFYKYSFGYHLYLQPSFQYVVNPSRFDVPLRDALISIVRIGINLGPY